MSLTPAQLQSRRRLDYRIVRVMAGEVLRPEAYRTAEDLEHRTNPITSERDGHLATKYLVTFRVPTLIGPGRFAEETAIGFDLAVRDYPYAEPHTWIVSKHVPYSPHFRAGYPVCIGEVWCEEEGRWLLGHLLRHIARLLNWDEVARGGGYVGWNRDAVAYHRRVYNDRPLDPGLRYPVLPLAVTHNATTQRHEELFTPRLPASVALPWSELFTQGGRARP
jgi:hypothetical protein